MKLLAKLLNKLKLKDMVMMLILPFQGLELNYLVKLEVLEPLDHLPECQESWVSYVALNVNSAFKIARI